MLSFIKKANKDSVCDYGQFISDFLGDSCLPGLDDAHAMTSKTDREKLCNLCESAPTSPSIFLK